MLFKDMRLKFCKTGESIYFSHLDLNRAVLRALRRSGIPYWSKGGFSPHPYCVFAQPLSLGFESTGELLDFRLLPDAEWNPEDLKNAFPESLKVLEIYEPKDNFKEIAFATYEVELETDVSAETIAAAYEGPLTVLKKTKRSEQEVDLREFIRKIEVKAGTPGTIFLWAELAAGNQRSLSPNYLAEGLNNAEIPCRIKRVCRLNFLKENGVEIC
ncbi:MAG: DUF2344 domain-containing protein [Clostridia bacterium]|nr:DUF2344 domain-containing protein [Clostridia bacterium]